MPQEERPREADAREGKSNSDSPEGPGGMVSEVDLVNGLPPEGKGPGKGGSWLPGRKGRKRTSLRVIAERAEEPLPGSDDRR